MNRIKNSPPGLGFWLWPAAAAARARARVPGQLVFVLDLTTSSPPPPPKMSTSEHEYDDELDIDYSEIERQCVPRFPPVAAGPRRRLAAHPLASPPLFPRSRFEPTLDEGFEHVLVIDNLPSTSPAAVPARPLLGADNSPPSASQSSTPRRRASCSRSSARSSKSSVSTPSPTSSSSPGTRARRPPRGAFRSLSLRCVVVRGCSREEGRGLTASVTCASRLASLPPSFAFYVLPDANDASFALRVLDQTKFGKNLLHFNKFSDVERFANVEPEWTEPQEEPFTAKVRPTSSPCALAIVDADSTCPVAARPRLLSRPTSRSGSPTPRAGTST